MRAVVMLPLVAATLLSACGSGKEEEAAGGLTADQVASEASGLVQPKPGQYRATLELLEFNVPGMPDSARQQMEQVFASGLAEGNTFCMKEEDTAQDMLKNLAESDCEVSRFDVSGNSLVSEMQCAGEGGGIQTVKMEGEMNAESSTMTMDMRQEMPNVGALNMKIRVNSERIGDCA